VGEAGAPDLILLGITVRAVVASRAGLPEDLAITVWQPARWWRGKDIDDRAVDQLHCGAHIGLAFD
jgi:hypothetical protein